MRITRKLFLTTALAALLGIGAFVGASSINSEKPVEVTEATAASKEMVLILGTHDNPGQEYFMNDKTIIWYWGTGLTSKAIEINKIHNRLAYVILPKGVENFKVCRVPTSYVTPNTEFPGTVYNTTGDVSFSGTNNVFNITGWDNSYSWGGYKTLLPKDYTVFFDASALTSFHWSDASAVPHLYSYLNNEWYYVQPSTAWNAMTRIGTTEKYYFTPSSDMVLDGLIFTRNNPVGDPSWSTVWSQTTDVTANDGFNPLYVTYLKNTQTGGKEDWDVGSYQDTADAYGDYMLSQITCSNGVSAPNTSGWTNAKNLYSKLSSLVQYEMYSASANEKGEIREQALARYDLIISRYGTTNYPNYINRTVGSSGRITIFGNLVSGSGTTTTIVVIAVSSVAIAAVGGYFLFKKKKQD